MRGVGSTPGAVLARESILGTGAILSIDNCTGLAIQSLLSSFFDVDVDVLAV